MTLGWEEKKAIENQEKFLVDASTRIMRAVQKPSCTGFPEATLYYHHHFHSPSYLLPTFEPVWYFCIYLLAYCLHV